MKSQCLILMIVMLVFSLTHYSFSTIRHVPTDYTTIQSAVNSTLDGDTVLLQTGTYFERIHVDFRKITVAGNYLFSHDTLDRDQTIITIPNSIRNDPGDTKSIIGVHHSDDFRLIGLTIRDGLGTRFLSFLNPIPAEEGCFYADSTRLTITGCRIVGGLTEGTGGMTLHKGSIFLTESAFDSNMAIGVDWNSNETLFADADSLILLHNRFFHNSSHGSSTILAMAQIYGKIDSCDIIENNCEFSTCGMECFGVTEICGNKIIGNRSPGTAGFAIINNNQSGGGGIFANNVIKDNVKYGNIFYLGGCSGGIIQAGNGQNWLIANNLFEGNISEGTGNGALLLQSGNYEITRNTFRGNTGSRFSTCLQLSYDVSATIDSNIFAYNVSTLTLENSTILFHRRPISIKYNDFYCNYPCTINNCDYTDSLLADHNWWGDASGPHAGNNLDGIGDSVDYRIPYMPWLTSSVFPMVIKEPSVTSVPTQFKLFQIAPNPFNSTTTIRFELPTQNQVEIGLTDITGRKVETLFSGKMSAGAHSTEFRGNKYASGTYFVHLRIGDQSQIKKVVLLK